MWLEMGLRGVKELLNKSRKESNCGYVIFTKPTLGVRSSQARVVTQGSAVASSLAGRKIRRSVSEYRPSFLTALRVYPGMNLEPRREALGIWGHSIDRHLRPPDGVIPCLTI